MPTKPRKNIIYMSNTGHSRYIISERNLARIIDYQQKIATGKTAPGSRLLKEIKHFFSAGNVEYDPCKILSTDELMQLAEMPAADFVQLIMNTRQPSIFAESEGAIAISHGEWNESEYNILANIASVLTDVAVYDNGKWGRDGAKGQYQKQSYKVNLLAIPGAVLNSSIPFDRKQLVIESEGSSEINKQAFIKFYKERLYSVFEQANRIAQSKENKAFITLPGIGNGSFAAEFRGKTIGLLHDAIAELIKDNPQWENIDTIVLDGYSSDICKDTEVNTTKLRVRNTGPDGKNLGKQLVSGEPFESLEQLSKAEEYAENEQEKKRFEACERFKILAWDHFSYEGNDWVRGSRFTDEATLAACNGISLLTGLKGIYNKLKGGFVPDSNECSTWGSLFESLNMKQSIADRLFVCKSCGVEQLESQQSSIIQRITLSNIIFKTLARYYPYGSDNASRWHARPAEAVDVNEKYAQLKGDGLKKAILNDFKENLSKCKSSEEVINFKQEFIKTPDYRILATPQGVTSRFFHLETSSVKALHLMATKAEQTLTKAQASPSTSSFKKYVEEIQSSNVEEQNKSHVNCDI